MRNALAYMLIALLGLTFFYIYSASTTRTLMFKSKYAAAQDKLDVVTSAFTGVENLNSDTAEQIMDVLGDLNVSRILVIDGDTTVLYDSAAENNLENTKAAFPEVSAAIRGSDYFSCTYAGGTLNSVAAMQFLTAKESIGCVYLTEQDSEEGAIIAQLESTILHGSAILMVIFAGFSIFFTLTGSERMHRILVSIRMAREGEYSNHIVMHGRDEYSKLATEFNQLTDRLQESEELQKQFVSNASHELKTPLASIKLLSDSILQNPMEPDTMREFVSDIGNEADRLTRMTQKLLSLSRSDSEQNEHEIVDMSDMVSRVFRMLVPLADEKGIRLTAQLKEDCTALLYEDDAYQVIFNLVENGIKYNQAEGLVHVSVSKTDEEVSLTISDTGVGIPAEALEHIFDRFYRVDKARSRQAGGAGLGLSIVREMVDRNFGAISVSSELGKGTEFTVTFPYIGSGENAE